MERRPDAARRLLYGVAPRHCGASAAVLMPARFAAVVLAAGDGRRLGGVAKALIRIAGEPLLLRLLRALRGAGIDDVLVVTGRHHDAIAGVLHASGARLLRNPHPDDGQQMSVRLALEHSNSDAAALLLVLCDQPHLETADLLELIGAYGRRPHGDFCLPDVAGRRGNPVIVSRQGVDAILRAPRSIACRGYMDLHPERVWRHATTNDHFIVDLDTIDDLAVAAARLGVTVELPLGGS